jgi:hypothetical protein
LSALPPARKMGGQIEKETNNSPQSSQSTLRKKIISALFGEILPENSIGFHEVSYKHRRWPQASSLIKIETFVARFRIRSLLGFVFRNNTGKM